MSRKRKIDQVSDLTSESMHSRNEKRKRTKRTPSEDFIKVYTKTSRGKGYDEKDWNEEKKRWASFRVNLPPEITSHILSFVGDKILPINKDITARMVESLAKELSDKKLLDRYIKGLPKYHKLELDGWWDMISVCQTINTAFITTKWVKNREDDPELYATVNRAIGFVVPRLHPYIRILIHMIPTDMYQFNEYFGKPPQSFKCGTRRISKMNTIVNGVIRLFHLSRILSTDDCLSEKTRGLAKELSDKTESMYMSEIRSNLDSYFNMVDGNRSVFSRTGCWSTIKPPTQRALMLFEIMDIGDAEYARKMQVLTRNDEHYQLAYGCYEGLFKNNTPEQILCAGPSPRFASLTLNPITLRILLTSTEALTSEKILNACQSMVNVEYYFGGRWKLEFMKLVAQFEYKHFRKMKKVFKPIISNYGSWFKHGESCWLDKRAIFHYVPATPEQPERIYTSYSDSGVFFKTLEEMKQCVVEFLNVVPDEHKNHFVRLVEECLLRIDETKCDQETIEGVFEKFEESILQLAKDREKWAMERKERKAREKERAQNPTEEPKK